jgi:hypothetical protein
MLETVDSVDIADLWAGWSGSNPGMVKCFFYIVQGPDQLWGPPSLVSNAYGGLFPRGKSA